MKEDFVSYIKEQAGISKLDGKHSREIDELVKLWELSPRIARILEDYVIDGIIRYYKENKE